jgi:hypothetical protein
MPFNSSFGFVWFVMWWLYRPTLGSITSKSPPSAFQSSADGAGADYVVDAGRERESVLLMAKVIHATWDISPYPEGKETPAPFISGKQSRKAVVHQY